MKKGDISNMPTPVIAIDLGVFVNEIQLGVFNRIKNIDYNGMELNKLNKIFTTGDCKVVILTNISQRVADKVEKDLEERNVIFSEVIYTPSIKDWVVRSHAMFYTEDSAEMLAIGPRQSKRWAWLQWI